MYELRVLSGLHRGATLPLDDHPHVIGASDNAEVVLVDPGIEERHARLQLAADGWVLSVLDGTVYDADSNRPQSELMLAPGDFARVGGVWVTVVDQDARWQNPPPEPVDQPQEEFESASAEQTEDETEAAFAANAGSDAPPAEVADYQSPEFDAPPLAETEPEHATQGDAPRGWRALFGRRVVYLPLAATVLSAAAAYAITSKPPTLAEEKKLGALAAAAQKQQASGKPGDRTIAAAFDAVNTDALPQRPLTPEELRKAFRKRLADVDLLKRFDLQLLDQQWDMQAALDDEEAARFERILTSFIKQHKISFPVHAKVGSSEAMLPFKIRQVISGSNASVVTQEGERLYVGDEYRGVRLVAIAGNQLSFAGKRKIEVRW